MQLNRCSWCSEDPLMLAYHDHEWGVPVYDDRKLFEFITLEGAQAGLSWSIILKRRENYRQAFDNFDAEKIATYNTSKIEQLLTNPGIIRNRLKALGTVKNAQAFLEIQKEFTTFASYMWQFVRGEPIINHWKTIKQVPVSTPESQAMAKDLKKRGFTFMGPTICYAHMQAVGMVNDHTINCFRHQAVGPTKQDLHFAVNSFI
ncbi:MAG: DNA-3-methyladenine glycosylase I [Alphaproteobacteria bacterium]|nr:DNA-3-methyladenine glycosylase I [Alphaproteobacteria bacterium]